VVRSCPSLAGHGTGREVDSSIPCGVAGLASCRVGKHARGGRVKARSRSALSNPRRAKPKGATGDVRAKSPVRRKGLRQGSNPRNRGFSSRPLLRRGNIEQPTVRGVSRMETCVYLSAGESSEGESQERCRCETKPARTQREQTVKRVAKPGRRNAVGRRVPPITDLRVLHVL
jgi:hypothetical protein